MVERAAAIERDLDGLLGRKQPPRLGVLREVAARHVLERMLELPDERGYVQELRGNGALEVATR